MKVFLIGFMGVGKSTVAHSLSSRMGLNMIDLDDSISRENGISISEIFSKKGAAFFREQEQHLLEIHINLDPEFVMATGGGTPCFYQNMLRMKDSGIVVWLDLPINQIVGRLKDSLDARPLIQDLNEQELNDYVAETVYLRKEYYSQAHIRIQSDDKLNIDLLVDQIKSYSR